MSDYTPSLHRLALLARDRRTMLASLLALYQECEGLSDAELGARLGGDRDALTKLALCLRPRMEAAHFQADVERIAAAAGVSPVALARLVRKALAYEVHGVNTKTTGTYGAAALLAARERDTDEPEPQDHADE